MSPSIVLAAYHRAGGRPPADDERLDIRVGGEFELWRTMGGPRVGAFAGRLSRDRRLRLASAVDALGDGGRAPVAGAAPRDSARESFATGRLRLDVPAGAPIRGAWLPLARLLRRWSDTLTDEPAAALGLVPAPGDRFGVPVLSHLGWAPVRLWTDSIHVALFARDRDGVIGDRSTGGIAREDIRGHGEPGVATVGWSQGLPIERIPEVPPGGVLETWVLLAIEGPTGPTTVRLTFRTPGAG